MKVRPTYIVSPDCVHIAHPDPAKRHVICDPVNHIVDAFIGDKLHRILRWRGVEPGDATGDPFELEHFWAMPVDVSTAEIKKRMIKDGNLNVAPGQMPRFLQFLRYAEPMLSQERLAVGTTQLTVTVGGTKAKPHASVQIKPPTFDSVIKKIIERKRGLHRKPKTKLKAQRRRR